MWYIVCKKFSTTQYDVTGTFSIPHDTMNRTRTRQLLKWHIKHHTMQSSESLHRWCQHFSSVYWREFRQSICLLHLRLTAFQLSNVSLLIISRATFPPIQMKGLRLKPKKHIYIRFVIYTANTKGSFKCFI